ncbi:MAG: hypothetical protein HRU40_03080 [Saprospiraceae bacterium]|nr:hypothetical protein [Saprospiraceae bacterium]
MNLYKLLFLLILTVSCNEHETVPVIDNSNTEIVELYFKGLKTNNVKSIPLTNDVVFEGPLLNESISGESQVRQFLGAIALSFKSAELKLGSIVSEKNNSCLIFDVSFPKDSLIIPVIDHIKFRNDSISYIRPYFDPRGYLEMNKEEN